jgi:hypothetical protein
MNYEKGYQGLLLKDREQGRQEVSTNDNTRTTSANASFTEEERSRFFSKVNKTSACWLWMGAKVPTGYGLFRFNGKPSKVHRLSFLIHTGVIPDGMSVLHKCDVPSCVNPDHLFLGTQADNIADMRAKGRERKAHGEANGNSSLTLCEVCKIRTLRAGGSTTLSSLAAKYHVSASTIGRVINNINWNAPQSIKSQS